jgi:RNA polymerase sigma factor (sigma-70 family)
MTSSTLSHLRHWLTRPECATDAVLLGRYVHQRDETAFAALMDRHGPMVLGVARRVVADHHLAEDVFQATFLTLARQAHRLRRPAALPVWLHRTACNLARTALRARWRRERIEANVRERRTGGPLEELSSRELLAVLDAELHRLPEVFRLPLVLCCLEGRSQDEAAALLGWTPGSVRGRLERGRQRLKERLHRRGLTFAIGAGVPLLLGRPALAVSLREATLLAIREGSASPLVSALVQQVSRPFLLSKGQWLAVVVVLGLAGVGVGLASLAGGRPENEPPAAPADDKPAASIVPNLETTLPQGAVARLGSAHLRIGNAAFALTPDGKTIVTVTPQGIVRRFDANTGRLLERKQLSDRRDADPMGQSHAQLSQDGRIVAIHEPWRFYGRRVTVWEVESGRRIFQRASTEDKRYGFGGLAPNGKRLALVEMGPGARKYQLRVYDLDTQRTRDLGPVEINVYGVHFSADGQRAVAPQISGESRDSYVACFDVDKGKELWRMPWKGGEMGISADGKMVLLASFGGERGFHVIETDPKTGKPTERFEPCEKEHPNVKFNVLLDNRTLVMNGFDGLEVWDMQKRKQLRLIKLPTNLSGYGQQMGAISPDNRTLITNVGYLQRWDLTTGKPFFDAPPDDTLGGPIEHLAFTADGKEVFASTWSLTSGRWNVTSGKRLSLTRQRYGRQLTRTPDGLRVLDIDLRENPEIKVIDPLAGKVRHTVGYAEAKEVGINGLRAFALTANGKTLLTAHGDEVAHNNPQTYVTATDMASGRRLSRFGVPGYIHFACSPCSPCGRWVVLNDKVYHVGTGTALFPPTGEHGERLVQTGWFAPPVWFSDDGRLMAGLLSKKEDRSVAVLIVWEVASGNVVSQFARVGFVAQLAFAPDGHTLAWLDGHGVRLVDLRSGKPLADYLAPDVNCELVNRGCTTQTLVFAPDGRTLATGHQDGTVLLWQVPQSPHKPTPLREAERDKLWQDLGSRSPSKARIAIEQLAGDPAAAVTLLTARFRPPAIAIDPELAALLRDLDSDVFSTRETASRKLREYGAKAEPALRRELARSPSLEMRRRLEGILDTLRPPALQLPLSGDALRGVRAIEVLERCATPQARKLLQDWAEQTKDVQLAIEARLALERVHP